MTIDEAKKLFKERYSQAGLNVAEEHPDGLVFSRGESKWHVDSLDLNEYIAYQSQFSKFLIKPTKCGICSQSYCEQALFGSFVPSAPLAGKGSEIVFGDRESGGPFAVISRASALFRSFFRFDPNFLEMSTRRLKDTRMARRKIGVRIVDRMIPVMVIRVENIEADSVEEASKIADGIISGCLFQMAAVRELPVRLRLNWPKKQDLRLDADKDDEVVDTPFKLLKVNPIRDLVSLYTLATGTSYPQFQFLAYYQVLEYFFVKIADEQLYSKITRRVNDLSFRCLPEHLDRIIQDVTEHRRESDETKMLKYVLEEFINKDELIAFLTEFEQQSETKQYTKKRTLFGSDVQIQFNPEYVLDGTAKTIKTVRNALVHSSDRYERAERYVPFTGNEELITGEIPLIRFLAEKVIVASATPVT